MCNAEAMPRRRLVIVLAALGLAVVLAVGLAQLGGSPDRPPSRTVSPAQARRALAGAPAPLAALHRQANRLLPGGRDAYRARLRALRGHPVVVNKWASWCGPCRFEFPFFQSQALKLGRQVAFLGLNSGDATDAARKFLEEFPVSYPSFEDPRERIARSVAAGNNYPITVFYDRRGKPAYLHQGVYSSEAKLARDIRRYALGS